MNPLKWMDEIERDQIPPSRLGRLVPEIEWQSLRTAIEAQAEELAQANDMLNDAVGIIEMVADKLGVEHEPHQTFNERLVEAAEKDWYKAYEGASWELAQKEARIARLEQKLRRTFKEIMENPHDVLDWSFIAVRIQRTLNESPAQSAAALKAEALREAVKEIRTMQRSGLKFDPVHTLEGRAARIEREAKES